MDILHLVFIMEFDKDYTHRQGVIHMFKKLTIEKSNKHCIIIASLNQHSKFEIPKMYQYRDETDEHLIKKGFWGIKHWTVTNLLHIIWELYGVIPYDFFHLCLMAIEEGDKYVALSYKKNVKKKLKCIDLFPKK